MFYVRMLTLMLDEILIYEFRNVVPWKSADLFHHFASKSSGEAWYSVERSPVRLLSHLAPCIRVRWHRLQLEARGVRFLSNGYRRRIKKKKRKWREKHGYKSTNVVYNEKMDTADGYKERIWDWVGACGTSGNLPGKHCWRNFFTSEEWKNFRNSADDGGRS